jgi:hypothetical protein
VGKFCEKYSGWMRVERIKKEETWEIQDGGKTASNKGREIENCKQ